MCVDRGVPIFGMTLDGNSSDKDTNHEMLTHFSYIMAHHGLGSGAFVYVADSAMVAGPNLKALEYNSFITRLPGNYDTFKDVITERVDERNWVTLGTQTRHPAVKSCPEAEYKVKGRLSSNNPATVTRYQLS